MKRKMRVAVLYGGRSAEHEISIQSARAILENLDPNRYQTLPVHIEKDGRWVLRRDLTASGGVPVLPSPAGNASLMEVSAPKPSFSSRVDVVFPALHGPMGEDGTMQGFLELCRIPYVGCGVLASAVGMDKEVAARLAEQAGIPTLPSVLARSVRQLKALRAAFRKWGLPVFVKPARLGSSIGITKVKRWSALVPAARRAFRYDNKVLVEKGVEAQEVCCAVLGEPGEVSSSVCGEVEVTGNHDFFDYEAKYFDEQGHRLYIPARLSAAEAKKIQVLAAKAFQVFEGHGMARVDFFVEKRSRRIYLGEINTIPGFTSHSLYPRLWEASGLPLPRLLDRLIELALKRRRSAERLKATG